MNRTSLRLAARGFLALAALLLLLPPEAFAHRLEKRFSVGVRPVINVRNKSGTVTVKSWNRPEVLVVATHISEKTEVDAEQVDNRIDVITHLVTQNVTPEELRADYEITVPLESELQIRNDAGDVRVEQISGDLTFDTVAANVDLREVAGLLLVRTISGSLVCVRCAGRIEVQSVSGNFHLVQPVSGNVRAVTTSGTIFFDGSFQPGGTYVLKSHTGVIDLLFSETDSFELNASSLHGKVENQATLKPFEHERRPATPSRYASSFFGTHNQGRARVQLSSFSGTIKIRKRSDEAR
jgi:DUF4097 and DUF4098 domain-containing protein YvlB